MRPPRIPRLALRLLLPPEPREVILGDLDEEFLDRVAGRNGPMGAGSARLWYWRMAVASLLAFWSPLRWAGRRRENPSRGAGSRSSGPPTSGPSAVRAGDTWPSPGVAEAGLLRGSVAAWTGDRIRDVRFAARSWARSPGPSVTVALTLALGIGVTTAVFSMADAVLLKPVPGVRQPDELVIVKFETPDGNGTGVSWPNAADLRATAPGLHRTAAYQSLSANVRPEGGVPRTARGQVVAGDYFGVLGVRPLLGRLPGPAELDDPDPPPVAVLTERFWRTAWGGDPSVVGSTLEVNGTSFTVVGVANDYEGTLRTSRYDFFLPGGLYGALRHYPPDYHMGSRSFRLFFQMVGRPGPDVDAATVQAQLRAGMEGLVAAHPDANGIHEEYRPTVYRGIGLDTMDQGRTARAMGILGLVVGLLLLIACANVANVLIARGVGRQGEASVRRALGASRRRLVAQHLTESVVLAVPGGLLGLGVAHGMLELLSLLPSLPLVGAELPALDGRVLVFALATTLATGLAFGLLPALLAGRRDPASGLATSTRQESHRTGVVRSGLTVVQIALSLTLVVGATLLVRSLASLSAVDLGFEAAGLSVHTVDPERQGYAEPEVDAFADALLAAVRDAPGVQAAALTSSPPFAGVSTSTLLRPADEPEREPLQPRVVWVSDGFFETLGQRITRGRDFTAPEQTLAPDQSPVSMLVNETLARALVGDGPAVGRQVVQPLYGGPVESTVVGVVADVRMGSLQEVEPVAYLPYRDRWGASVTALVRSGRPAEDVRRVVQGAAVELDPSLPLARSESLGAAVARATAEERLFATLLGLTAVLAGALAAVGLYGVVAHGVARRRRELGVRIAVGADHGRLVRNVLGRSAALGTLGILLGWLGAAVLSRLLESRLVGVEPFDVATFAGAGAAFLALTVMAAVVPAWSATRVDPSEALRAE